MTSTVSVRSASRLLLRGSDLRQSMSSYVADRIEQAANVDVLLQTELRRIVGDQRIKGIEVEHTNAGATRRIDASAVFSFIGAAPGTR